MTAIKTVGLELMHRKTSVINFTMIFTFVILNFLTYQLLFKTVLICNHTIS